MLQTIAAVNQAVNNFIWGVPAMVCIIGVGLLLSVRTGFIQIRKFPYAIKTTIGRMFRKRDASDGAMTPFQAVCTALAATVGTGNIAGVAGAIAIGGPGAVFWMWCSALLGMCTKFSEVTLAVHFRERNANGELVGGPMYYIKNGLAKHWRWLAAIYALFGVLTVFGTGNATQVNTIITAIDAALNQYAVVSDKAMATVNLVFGIVVAMLVALVLLGEIFGVEESAYRSQHQRLGELAFDSDRKLMTTIKCGRSVFNLMASEADEYPALADVASDKGLSLPQPILKSMIAQTIFSVSDNECKPIHTGCLLEIEGSRLNVVAVDGYRLSVRRETVEGVPGDMKFDVPGASLREIERILGDDDDIVEIFPDS